MIDLKSTALVAFLYLTFLASSHAQPNALPPSARESIEWCDIWLAQANETNLPRVLLIGDSISRDYYPLVQQHFAGKAYVGRLSTSRFIGDPVILTEIASVLDGTKFDLIHFNNGMHGWQHSEEEYAKAFPKFLETIRKHAPHAKLIWATTTTLKESKPLAAGDSTHVSDERIAARNALAEKIVTAKGIPIDDLNAVTHGHPEYHSDNVHMNSDGNKIIAAQVSQKIDGILPQNK